MKYSSRKKFIFLMALCILGTSATIFAAPKLKPVRSYLASSFKYTINGKAALDKSPTIIYKDTVFVPVEDLVKALGHQVTIKDGVVTISTCDANCPSPTPIPRPTPAPTPIPRPTPNIPNGVIPRAEIIAIDFNTKTVTVVPAGKENSPENQVALKVTPNTVITDGKTKKLYSIEDLNTSMQVKVVHSPVMTKSIPPQTEALEITLLGTTPPAPQPR